MEFPWGSVVSFRWVLPLDIAGELLSRSLFGCHPSRRIRLVVIVFRASIFVSNMHCLESFFRRITHAKRAVDQLNPKGKWTKLAVLAHLESPLVALSHATFGICFHRTLPVVWLFLVQCGVPKRVPHRAQRCGAAVIHVIPGSSQFNTNSCGRCAPCDLKHRTSGRSDGETSGRPRPLRLRWGL